MIDNLISVLPILVLNAYFVPDEALFVPRSHSSDYIKTNDRTDFNEMGREVHIKLVYRYNMNSLGFQLYSLDRCEYLL